MYRLEVLSMYNLKLGKNFKEKTIIYFTNRQSTAFGLEHNLSFKRAFKRGVIVFHFPLC